MKTLILAPIFLLTAACATAADSGQRPTALAEEGGSEPHLEVAPAAVPSSGLSDEVMYHVLVGEIAGQRGQLDVAVDHYLMAATLSDDPAVAERATRVSLYARDDSRSLAAARRWVARDGDNLEARQVLAALLLRTGHPGEAYSQLDAVMDTPVDERARFAIFSQIASLLAQEGGSASLDLMGRLVAERDDNPSAHYAHAQLALMVEEPEVGLDAVDKALELRPDWPEAVILKSGVLTQMGREEAALKALAEAMEYTDSSELRLYYARKLVELDRFDEGAKQFARLLEDNPNDTDALYALGLIAIQQQRYDEAKMRFSQLLDTGERTDSAAYFLGEIAESRKRSEEALEWYERVGGRQYGLDARIRTAVILARLGREAEARQELAAIRPESSATELRLILAEGEVLRELGEYQEAYELYSEGLERIPDSSELLYARALIAEKLDRLDALERDLQTILEEDPDNAQALNALGYTLADRTDRHDEALRYTERALQLRPDDAAVIDSMGWVHYRLGNHEQALQYLQRAFDMLKDPEIAAHLGEVLWVTGKQEEARQIWDQGLAEDPDHPALRRVLERFAE